MPNKSLILSNCNDINVSIKCFELGNTRIDGLVVLFTFFVHVICIELKIYVFMENHGYPITMLSCDT